jgi:hypothetical protein
MPPVKFWQAEKIHFESSKKSKFYLCSFPGLSKSRIAGYYLRGSIRDQLRTFLSPNLMLKEKCTHATQNQKTHAPPGNTMAAGGQRYPAGLQLVHSGCGLLECELPSNF